MNVKVAVFYFAIQSDFRSASFSLFLKLVRLYERLRVPVLDYRDYLSASI